jgi:hypothetical protein
VSHLAVVCTFLLSAWVPAFAQTAESVGERAEGMGGAFVAVASDSSATWWNPAGIAAGPFVDVTIGRTRTEAKDVLPVWRQRTIWFALATPPFAVSYYRFRITDIQPFNPTGRDGSDREEGRAGVPVSSLSASHVGLTLTHTLIPGIHAGGTVKYVRGTFHTGREDSLADPDDLLDRGDALEEGSTEGRFDLDVGLLAVKGPLRVGARMRNVMKPEFGRVRLPRQTRIGVAFDPEPVTGLPLTIAVDADLNRYVSGAGLRRVVAIGAEQWFLDRRLGIRAGGRVNTAGAQERAITGGASVAVRTGLYVDGHVTHGRQADERGWGIGARVSF